MFNKTSQINGYVYEFEDGVRITVNDMAWSKSGKLYSHITVEGPPGANPAFSGGLDWSDVRRRYEIAEQAARLTAPTVPLPMAAPMWAAKLADVYEDMRHEEAEVYNIGQISEPLPMRFLVPGLVPENYTTALFGDGGVGKSMLALALGMAASSGTDWLGLPVTQTNVLYLDWELDWEVTTGRLYRLSRGLQLDTPPDMFYASMKRPLVVSLESIDRMIQHYDIGLLIVDSLGPASGADPGNVEATIAVMSALRRLNTTTLLIDHQSKGAAESYASKRQYGSVYKGNLARSVVQLQVVNEIDGGLACKLRHQKSNFMKSHDEICYLVMYQDRATSILLGDPQSEDFESQDKPSAWRTVFVLMEPGRAYTIKELAEETGLAVSTIRSAINRELKPKNWVVKGQKKDTWVRPVLDTKGGSDA